MATVSGAVGGAPSAAAGQGVAQSNAFPDEKKIRELAEQIRVRLSHAHQLKLTASQQQQAAPAAAMQISQAEEIKKRLQEAIVQLQGAIQDVTLAGMREWLGGVAQRLSLKLELQHSQQLPGTTVFLIHEGFYVEICCHDNDNVTSVKLSQANITQEDSVILARLLLNRDFTGFENHLKCLVQFYNQATNNCEPALMYRALSAMESVLITINERSPQAATDKVIMENPLGHVTPRQGGLPMQLTFFIHPHEVIRNVLMSAELGVSVGVAGKVTMEKSRKFSVLSTDPNLFDVLTANFFPMTVRNSSTLPLTFVFELTQPTPVCSLVRDELLKICGTEHSMLPVGSLHINQLVAKRKAEKEGKDLITDKWRLVCLPDQQQYYLMPAELRSLDALPEQIASPQFCGAMVTKVPFLHPGKIFNIIMLLRKQLVYNALISSCLGRSKRGVPPPAGAGVKEYIFEVTSIPPNQVTVAMDMQSEETMIVDFLVPDQKPTDVEVRIKTNMDSSPILQKMLSTIAQRCLSIPVTLRAALSHSSQLLEQKPALLLQNYHQSVKEFERAIHSGSSGDADQELGLVGRATMNMHVSDHVTLLGQETELTNLM